VLGTRLGRWAGVSTVPVTAAALDAHHAVNVRAPALLIADSYRRHVKRGGTWGRVSSDGRGRQNDAMPS
jgi:hypothetical protein